MQSLLGLVSSVIGIYVWCVIAYAILSLLYSFQILNTHSQIAYRVYDVLGQLVEPALRFLRRFIPTFGAVDITPVILILLLNFSNSLIHEYAGRLLF